MANLYELSQDFLHEFDRIEIDEKTGEITEAPNLDELSAKWDEKIENCALFYKNLLSEAEALKNEKLAFAKRQKAAETKAEWIKNYMDTCMKIAGTTKFETTKCKLSFRKSEEVVIKEGTDLASEYTRIKVEPNKDAIKTALKNGTEIEGCSIVEKQNLQVK